MSDPPTPSKYPATADWNVVATDVSDMWHIFAHGVHWISYSTKSAPSSLYLLILDTSLSVTAGPLLIADSAADVAASSYFDAVTFGNAAARNAHAQHAVDR